MEEKKVKIRGEIEFWELNHDANFKSVFAKMLRYNN